jgi:hypothetical protein
MGIGPTKPPFSTNVRDLAGLAFLRQRLSPDVGSKTGPLSRAQVDSGEVLEPDLVSAALGLTL